MIYTLFTLANGIHNIGTFFKFQYIFRISHKQDQWAFTLSLNGGCFQANMLAVKYVKNSLQSLKNDLKTLIYDKGCFPFEY